MSKEKKGRKIGRNKKHQAPAYKAGMRLERNRKRRWRRVLREQPDNAELLERYEAEYGEYEAPPETKRIQRRRRHGEEWEGREADRKAKLRAAKRRSPDKE